jgi:hypothetical protein
MFACAAALGHEPPSTLTIKQDYTIMHSPHDEEEYVEYIPLWVFFASGSKWLGGFVTGCIGLFGTKMLTTDPHWISLVTAIATFVGWSSGTYLDINTYLKKRLR